jgi:hypothetical protein
MSEVDRSVGFEPELPTQSAVWNRVRQVFGGGVAVLATLTLAGSHGSALKHNTESNGIVSPMAHIVPENVALDLVSDLPEAKDDSSRVATAKLTPEPLIPNTLDAAKLAIPSAVANNIRHNALYLPFADGASCSASAIRNRRHQVIGVLTAEHCQLNYANANSILGSNHEYYITQPKPVMAYSGENLERLTRVAEIDQWIVPDTEHTTTQDMAFGVAKGHTPNQVLKAYRQSALTAKAIRKLKPGTTIYMGGYPWYQPDNWTDNEQRQMFAMTVLGTATVQPVSEPGQPTKRVKVLQAAVPTDEQGAVCSQGASGSEGFVEVGNHEESIGEALAFDNLGNSIPDGSGPNVGISKYLPVERSTTPSAVCDFAYQIGVHNDVAVDAVRSVHEIPGHDALDRLTAPEAIISKLADPDYPKTVLNGIIKLAGSIDYPTEWVSNPVIFQDKKYNLTVLAYANANNPGHLESFYTFKDDGSIEDLEVYPHPGSDVVNFLSLKESFRYSDNPHEGFVSSGHQGLGAKLRHSPKMLGSALKLGKISGHLGVMPDYTF